MRLPGTHATVLLTVMTVTTLGLAAPAAADVSCTGTIGAQSIDDTVVVPDGASCTLDGTHVDGSVLVGLAATLTVRNATIGGNIQDDNNNAGAVTVTDSTVGGSIQLEQGTAVTVTGTAVEGDLQLESNRSDLRADGNTIGGNLQANQNTGGLALNGNTIDGNLQCQSNSPVPTGSGNIVHGSAENQCATLTGGGPTPPPAPAPATCTGQSVPDAGFTDTAGNPHQAAIDCVVFHGVAQGTSASTYSPRNGVNRAQMASFLTRTIRVAGASLPAGGGQFSDVSGSPHADNIEQLAAAGIVQGVGGGRYAPGVIVTRAQMAAFLARAFEYVHGAPLPLGQVAFADITGNTHEDAIRRVAGAGFAQGTTPTTYSPAQGVRRDQMAAFLTRLLERFAADGRLSGGQ